MKKNIVIIVSAMNMGGAQRVVSILCNYWSQHGHNVTLISTFSGDKEQYYKLNKNVALEKVDAKNNPEWYNKHNGQRRFEDIDYDKVNAFMIKS